MLTPWGTSNRLRERMLPPGPATAREEVERNQRERLYAATVACVGSREYEDITVADLLELSGVSRSAFYDYFRDKEDCVLETFEAVVEMAVGLLERELGKPGSVEDRTRDAIDALMGAIAEQPAAARLCLGSVYTVGTRGREAAERAAERFGVIIGQTINRDSEDVLPEQMVWGVIGGIEAVIQAHLRRGAEAVLTDYSDDLCEWAMAYRPPSVPLRIGGRAPRPLENPPPFVAYSRAERIIRALAASAGERGYPAVTIAEVAARASVSQATFYSHFADKETALVAALDSIGGRLLGVVMPAARRAPDWRHGVRAAIGALCGFFAAEPTLARLAAVEVYAAGPGAVEQRNQIIVDEMRGLIGAGYEEQPRVKPIVADALMAMVWAQLNRQIVDSGPRSLPGIAPLISYMILQPFVGAEDAAEVANGDGRGA